MKRFLTIIVINMHINLYWCQKINNIISLVCKLFTKSDTHWCLCFLLPPSDYILLLSAYNMYNKITLHTILPLRHRLMWSRAACPFGLLICLGTASQSPQRSVASAIWWPMQPFHTQNHFENYSGVVCWLWSNWDSPRVLIKNVLAMLPALQEWHTCVQNSRATYE
jgi:hypothetical protein